MDDIIDALAIFPPLDDTCPECADGHDPAMPHNRNSLYYHLTFYRKNGRLPTWKDAMAHCSESIQAAWTEKLKEQGIRIE